MFFWCLFSLISSVEKNKGWSWAEASISVVKSLPLIISSEFLAWIFYTFWILFQVSYLYSLRTVCWRLEVAYKMNNVWCNGRIYMCIYVYLYVCVCVCVWRNIVNTSNNDICAHPILCISFAEYWFRHKNSCMNRMGAPYRLRGITQ